MYWVVEPTQHSLHKARLDTRAKIQYCVCAILIQEDAIVPQLLSSESIAGPGNCRTRALLGYSCSSCTLVRGSSPRDYQHWQASLHNLKHTSCTKQDICTLGALMAGPSGSGWPASASERRCCKGNSRPYSRFTSFPTGTVTSRCSHSALTSAGVSTLQPHRQVVDSPLQKWNSSVM